MQVRWAIRSAYFVESLPLALDLLDLRALVGRVGRGRAVRVERGPLFLRDGHGLTSGGRLAVLRRGHGSRHQKRDNNLFDRNRRSVKSCYVKRNGSTYESPHGLFEKRHPFRIRRRQSPERAKLNRHPITDETGEAL